MGPEAAASAERPPRRWVRWLPAIALVVFSIDVAIVLAVAGSTLGYDFRAYLEAAHRILDGQPLYGSSAQSAGEFGLYYYPPPFVLLVTPFALLPETAAVWVWTGALVVAFLLGTRWLPVRRETRWLIVLFGGLMWPLLYSLKLGQVGPLLYLAFAAGWRWMDVPWRLGAPVAFGTIVKIQPVLLIGWSVATRRFAAATWTIGFLLVVGLISTLVLGWSVWGDYLALLGRVASPVTTPDNLTPGAVAYRAGLPETASTILQWASVAVVALVMLWSWVRAPAIVGYLVTVVASQLVSPILWDHYAMLLLLPVAYLLDRRQWWAALVPLALALPVVTITPQIAYPICFVAMLVGPLVAPASAHGPRATSVAGAPAQSASRW